MCSLAISFLYTFRLGRFAKPTSFWHDPYKILGKCIGWIVDKKVREQVVHIDRIIEKQHAHVLQNLFMAWGCVKLLPKVNLTISRLLVGLYIYIYVLVFFTNCTCNDSSCEQYPYQSWSEFVYFDGWEFQRKCE